MMTRYALNKELVFQDFPGGSVFKTPCFQYWEHRFTPWSGDLFLKIPHASQLKDFFKKRTRIPTIQAGNK